MKKYTKPKNTKHCAPPMQKLYVQLAIILKREEELFDCVDEVYKERKTK